MADPRAKYEAALAAFAAPGGRWANKGALTYWGKAAGLTADEIVADARAAGVTNRDGSIRSGWKDAPTHGTASRPPREPQPPPPSPHAGHVRNLIAAGGGLADWDALTGLSPCRDWFGHAPSRQTELFMRAAFAPDEQLHVFRHDVPTKGVPWVNIRPARDWLERLPYEPLPGDLIVGNPLTGRQGMTTDGKPSFISKDCLAAFPFAVVEMDDAKYAFGARGDVARGLRMQCAFWRGFILKSKLAPALVALVYSGGKSIHGLLHVGCATLEERQAARAWLVALFAADPECVTGADGKIRTPYRVDVQALEPRQGVRIPGVRRFDRGTDQELLYLNPDARTGTMWHDGGWTV